jgi:hypothetical protein
MAQQDPSITTDPVKIEQKSAAGPATDSDIDALLKQQQDLTNPQGSSYPPLPGLPQAPQAPSPMQAFAQAEETGDATDTGKSDVVQAWDDVPDRDETDIDDDITTEGRAKDADIRAVTASLKGGGGFLESPTAGARFKLPASPELQARNVFEQFRNPLLLAALFLPTLAGKHGAKLAMAGATGFMNGFAKGDKERMQLEQQRFKNGIKKAIAEGRKVTNGYMDILRNPNIPVADKMSQARTWGVEHGDQIGIGFLDKGQIGAFYEWAQNGGKMTDRLAAAWDKANKKPEEDEEDRVNAILDYREPPDMKDKSLMSAVRKKAKERDEPYSVTEWNRRQNVERSAGTAEGKAKAVADATKDLDPTQPDPQFEDNAQGMARGNWRAVTGLPPVLKARVAARANEIAKGLPGNNAQRAQEYAANMRAAQTAGNIEGRISTSLQKAEAAAPIVVGSSQRVDRSRFPDINSVLLAASKGLGGTDVVNFGIQMNTLINNYALAQSGGVQGAITVDAARHAREMISTAYNKRQVLGAVATMLFEIRREEAASKQAVTSVIGGETQPVAMDERMRALQWIANNPSDPNALKVFYKLYPQ